MREIPKQSKIQIGIHTRGAYHYCCLDRCVSTAYVTLILLPASVALCINSNTGNAGDTSFADLMERILVFNVKRTNITK